MNKTNGNNKNTGYKGKYYDPNYKQNKAKYGDLYDPKDFAVLNPNWEPKENNKRTKRNSNYKGRHYDPNYHKMTPKQRRAKKNKEAFQGFITFLIILAVFFVYESTNKFTNISNPFTQTKQATNVETVNNTTTADSVIEPNIDELLTNTEIATDSCDSSGNRQANVKANIGYGNRNYYGYTNEYSQLVYVQADSLLLQNSSTEDLTSDGRYCEGQANVEGASDPYNRGHGIGDALGGDSNSYNIFPQLSSINGGAYNDVERELQDTLYNGGSVTNFELKLTYPNSSTNIPSKYTMSYELNGVYDEHTFNN